MATIDVLDAKGKKTATADLDDALFGIEPHQAVLHQVVTAQLAAHRSGTQSTKTRAEVRGGGAKPWKQKGTGRARQGSIRSPQWNGGGVALGPKPRSYAQRTPKKMVRLALRSALSDRASDGRVKVVDFGLDAPKTSKARAALGDLGLDGKVLLVLDAGDEATWKSFRNLTDVHICVATELNAYDVLVADWVVFTPGTVPTDAPLSRGGAAKAVDTDVPTPDAGDPPVKAAAAEPAPVAYPGSHDLVDEDGTEAPEGFEIKGNEDSMKFHVPGSQWYEQTKAEVWFASAADAEAAGFEPAGGAEAQAEEDDA